MSKFTLIEEDNKNLKAVVYFIEEDNKNLKAVVDVL